MALYSVKNTYDGDFFWNIFANAFHISMPPVSGDADHCAGQSGARILSIGSVVVSEIVGNPPEKWESRWVLQRLLAARAPRRATDSGRTELLRKKPGTYVKEL